MRARPALHMIRLTREQLIPKVLADRAVEAEAPQGLAKDCNHRERRTAQDLTPHLFAQYFDPGVFRAEAELGIE